MSRDTPLDLPLGELLQELINRIAHRRGEILRVFAEDVLGRGPFQVINTISGTDPKNGTEAQSTATGRWIEQSLSSESTARGKFSWILQVLPGQLVQISTIEFVPAR